MGRQKSLVEKLREQPEGLAELEKEAVAFEATEVLSRLMAENNVTKAELARRLGKTKSLITQLLSGSRNMTLHTFAEIAYALNTRIHFQAEPLRQAYQINQLPSIVKDYVSEQPQWSVQFQPRQMADVLEEIPEPWICASIVAGQPQSGA